MTIPFTPQAAPDEKRLRVLSGLHAGANLHLPPGTYRLMAEDGLDEPLAGEAAWQPLSFLDWSGESLTLEIQAGPGGNRAYLNASASASENADAPHWDDFDPRRLGGLVLCVGDAQAPWPTDEQLLRRLHAPTPAVAPLAVARAARAPAQHARPTARIGSPRVRHTAAGLGVGLLLAVSTLFGGPGHPPVSRSVPVAASDLERKLHDHGLSGLSVLQEGNGLLITGLVASAEQDTIAQQLLEPLRGPALRAQWAVAADIAATIDGALRAPQVRTRYLGDGRFVAEGQADSPARVQASAEQLRRDLGPVLRELTVNVTAIRRTPQFTSAVAAGGLRYDERRDGTKRFGSEESP